MLTFNEVVERFLDLNNLNKDWLLYNYIPESNYLNPSKQLRSLTIFIYNYYISNNIYLNDYDIYILLRRYCASKMLVKQRL